VKGQQYSSAMPPYGTGQEMSDAEVAAVVSYIRTSWGNSAGPVTAEQVAAVRKETAAHTGMMTEADLKAAMQATP
jgi:mono/diheme cytochrome c family protein